MDTHAKNLGRTIQRLVHQLLRRTLLRSLHSSLQEWLALAQRRQVRRVRMWDPQWERNPGVLRKVADRPDVCAPCNLRRLNVWGAHRQRNP
jgi:hypothetical protein